MKLKFFIITFIFTIISTASHSKPRCENFYDKIYNSNIYDVDRNNAEQVKEIGFRFKQNYLHNKDEFVLEKNKNGFLYVGKIVKENLAKELQIGDLILSINGKKTSELNFLEDNISDLYKKDQKITLLIERNINGLLKQKTIETKIDLIDKNEINLDLYVNSIEVDEKDGVTLINLETDFFEFLDDTYFITKASHDELVYNRTPKSTSYEHPTRMGEEYYFFYEECLFPKKRWQTLNSRDPAYGIKFGNLVSEDLTTRTENYLIYPQTWPSVPWEQVTSDSPQYNVTYLHFKGIGDYKFKNKFNLKTFPFDKQEVKIFIYADRYQLDFFNTQVSDFTYKMAKQFSDSNPISGWNITNFKTEYELYKNPTLENFNDGFSLVFDIERKSGYYIFKIIFPIVLILMICWSAVWIDPKEIESRLTVTIVCLLSLIAYNFVIDSELPKLEYLTIMDYMILISYIYAAIPNFLSIYSFYLIKKNKKLAEKYETYEKKYGLPSYIIIIFLIIIINTNSSPEHTNAMFSWMN